MRRSISGVAAFGLVGVGAVGLGVSAAAAPAHAFAGTCPVTVPAATLVADNVCEVQITTVGASTFTPPSGITKLSAVLVGGGGGGLLLGGTFYAGSGGQVIYIDSVPTGGAIALDVGAAGAPSSNPPAGFIPPTNGGATTLVAGTTTTAAGGNDGGSASPACQAGPAFFASGNGARTPADASCNPGLGFSLSQVSGLDATMFPAASLGPAVYGNGGAGSVTDPVAAPVGIGTGGSVNGTTVEPGTAGLVILRFKLAPTLAATGSEVPAGVPAAAAGMLGLGAMLLVFQRRRKVAR